MKKKHEPHPDDSTRRDSFVVHPNWAMFGQRPGEQRGKKNFRTSDVEALLTGRLVLNHTEKELLISNLIRVMQGPPNDPQVGEALMEIIDSGYYLAIAGNLDEFFLKVFGFAARVSQRVMQAYRAGRWDTLVPANFGDDDKPFRRAPRVYAPSPVAPQHPQTHRGQNAAPIARLTGPNNAQAEIAQPICHNTVRSDEAIKLLRALSPARGTLSISQVEALLHWAEDTHYRSDLLRRAVAGKAQLSVDGQGNAREVSGL